MPGKLLYPPPVWSAHAPPTCLGHHTRQGSIHITRILLRLNVKHLTPHVAIYATYSTVAHAVMVICANSATCVQSALGATPRCHAKATDHPHKAQGNKGWKKCPPPGNRYHYNFKQSNNNTPCIFVCICLHYLLCLNLISYISMTPPPPPPSEGNDCFSTP